MHAITKEELIETVKTRETWDLNSISDCPYCIALLEQGYDDVTAFFKWARGWHPDRIGVIKIEIPCWYQAVVSIALHTLDAPKTPSVDIIALLEMPEDELLQMANSLRREGIFGPMIRKG
jgi:hypothetical protein